MELLTELVQIFAAEYPDLLHTIEESGRTGDATTLRKASHKLKGSLLQFSAPKASDAAANLEAIAASHSLEKVPRAVDQLKDEIDCVMGLLQSMVASAEANTQRAGEN